MTFFYNNVYLDETATVCGPYEKQGPLRRYFDKTYDDFYCGEKTFEKGEIKLVKDSFVLLMKKSGITKEEIELVIGGDLLNQITASTFGSCGIGKSFIGVYGACSNSVLSLIIASNFIQANFITNAACFTSSHNLTSERQFRNPIEYGAPRPSTATFTATGAANCLLVNEETDIKIDCATLGRIIDYNQNDPNNMGKVMAPAAIDTFIKHLEETKRTPDYYDLIVTGDLGKYGKEIFLDYLETQYNIHIKEKYNDCGVILYDLDNQPNIQAGGSGPVCSALVVYSYLVSLLKEKKLKRILFLATGALFSQMSVYQKENINSICHAISLEAI